MCAVAACACSLTLSLAGCPENTTGPMSKSENGDWGFSEKKGPETRAIVAYRPLVSGWGGDGGEDDCAVAAALVEDTGRCSYFSAERAPVASVR